MCIRDRVVALPRGAPMRTGAHGHLVPRSGPGTPKWSEACTHRPRTVVPGDRGHRFASARLAGVLPPGRAAAASGAGYADRMFSTLARGGLGVIAAALLVAACASSSPPPSFDPAAPCG